MTRGVAKVAVGTASRAAVNLGAAKASPVALHATTIRFADRGIYGDRSRRRRAGDQRHAVRPRGRRDRAVLDELDSAEEAIHSAHDVLAIARGVRRPADVDPPGAPRASAGRRLSVRRRAATDEDPATSRLTLGER